MAVMTTDVRRGMSVYDSGGHKIGSVLEIYGSQYGADEPGLAPPQGQTPSGDPLPFLKICREGLGRKGKELYVPTEAVQGVEGEDRVVLSCTADALEQMYAA